MSFMQTGDRLFRWAAFYVSVALFLVLLPIILSYSLGFKVDWRALKIYKTGIISIKTQPPGATVFIDGATAAVTTPALIEELKPGTYPVIVRKSGYYPWQKELVVRPNMVTKAEDIVLFQNAGELIKLASTDVSAFAVSPKGLIYCMTPLGLIVVDAEGQSVKRISAFNRWPDLVRETAFSPDGDKFLFRDDTHIWAVDLRPQPRAMGSEPQARVEELVSGEEPISRMFWYSQSNYVIYVSGRLLVAVELSGAGKRNTVTLYRFESEPRNIFYDQDNDSFYFTDGGSFLGTREKLYRLDLRKRFITTLLGKLGFRKEAAITYEQR